MLNDRDIVPAASATRGDGEAVPLEHVGESDGLQIETSGDAEQAGPDAEWKFWDDNITAARLQERRFRVEADEVEELYFGPDEDPGEKTGADRGTPSRNRISDKVALIHANIDTLKPMLFSETPQPVVRRRFRGDGKIDEADVMAAEVGQRLAVYLLDTEPFDEAMEKIRDDWLIAGRGAGRIIYLAETSDIQVDVPDGMGGVKTVDMPVKTMERVSIRHIEWRRLVLSPTESWEQMPFEAIEIPMTRSKMAERFGAEKADATTYNQAGLIGASRPIGDEDRDQGSSITPDSETGEPAKSPFDTTMVWEIWNKEERKVIWWSAHYKQGVLDSVEDPLELEDFWPMPKPLLATTRGNQMNPRPDIKYYEMRAREIDLATEKMRSILNVLSISALVPGSSADKLKELLGGKNVIIPVDDWIALMEKGGSQNVMQWLPLQHMISAVQALIAMREQSKQAMFEASGVSDIMRAQGDPNETATAQQLKGRYAGLRLSDRQRRIAIYARDMLRLMVEVAVEHFDTDHLAEITGLDLPMTEVEREQMVAQQQMAMQQYQQAMKMYAAAQQAIEQGTLQGDLGPPPQEPEFDRIPGTSWEVVHGRLKTDYMRKISVSIETNSTILADEQGDKEARIEFLSAFAQFVGQLSPLMSTGQFDPKTMKELLMFGIRGFPQSRTLEGLIASLPDEPQGEPPEDTAVTVAKIRAEVDTGIEQMRQENNKQDRVHEKQMKGADMIVESERAAQPMY